jgi:acyl-CoA synthetase (AMP-forming)/AMP-acid ligase II
VLVRGPSVAAVAARTDADGWLDTGDLGRLDGLGRLWLLGRTANAAFGGLAPAEIEEPVTAVRGVGAAALVAIEGASGPRQVLAVEGDAFYSAATDRDVSSLVAGSGWPIDRIAVLGRLPRDERSGTKVDYPRLRAMLCRRDHRLPNVRCRLRT